MKKIIIILLVILFLTNFIYSEDFSKILKNNIGNVVNIWILGTYSGYFRGKIIAVQDNYLVITADLNEKVSNPYGPDKIGKTYIKIDAIMAIRIADKEEEEI